MHSMSREQKFKDYGFRYPRPQSVFTFLISKPYTTQNFFLVPLTHARLKADLLPNKTPTGWILKELTAAIFSTNELQ
jgi:hypothetical protein